MNFQGDDIFASSSQREHMFGKFFLNHPVGMENKYVHDCVCLIYIDIYFV